MDRAPPWPWRTRFESWWGPNFCNMKRRLILHPVNLGNHDNTHYRAFLKGNYISIKLIVFSRTSTAYITQAKCAFPMEYVREDFILTDLKMLLNDRGTILENTFIPWGEKYTTEQIIEKYDLNGTV